MKRVFDFVIKPSNLTQIWPSLIEIHDEQLLLNGGYSAKWVYKMAGIYLEGTARCTDVLPNRWFSINIKGTVDSTITWTFRPKDDKTRVTITIEFSNPLPLAGWLTKIVITKMRKHETNLVLANLQARLEGSKN
jgi:hypothetical protein